MKVVCIDDGTEGNNPLSITIGRVYDVVKGDESGYYVRDDEGFLRWYLKERFSHAEWRDRQLKELGI